MEKSEVFTVDAQLEYMTVQRQHEYIKTIKGRCNGLRQTTYPSAFTVVDLEPFLRLADAPRPRIIN
jgi:hypothetical protein